jgi:hypothetical protein
LLDYRSKGRKNRWYREVKLFVLLWTEGFCATGSRIRGSPKASSFYVLKTAGTMLRQNRPKSLEA